MTAAIAFLGGLLFGAIVGLLVAGVLAASAIDEAPNRNTIYISRGIDPDALIAWIENRAHNYEYTAPPTSGEIIRKIQDMRKVE